MSDVADQHLLTILRDHALGHSDRIALTWADGECLNYGALWRDITALAAILEQKGLRRGDLATLSMDGSPGTVAAHFALIHLGVLTLLLDPTLPETVVQEQIIQIKPKLVLLPGHCLHGLAGLADPPELVFSIENLTELLATGQQLPPIPIRAAPDDPILLMNTTGSTGKPKSVLLTLANISTATAHINAFMGLAASDVEVLTLPLYHSFGLGRLRCLLAVGASAQVRVGRFRPEILLKTVRDHQATVFAQVPMGIQLILRFGRRIQSYLKNVRLLEIGSAPLALDKKRELIKYLPEAKICHHYGLTEASRSLFLDYGEAEKRGCLDSMGQEAPGVTVRLLSISGVQAEEGEIAVHGGHISPGYYQGGTVTAQPLRSDFFRSGDLARLDDQGFYHYLGRVDDIINLGGFKVQPLEVEQALMAASTNIAEVAVVGRVIEENMTIVACIVWCGTAPFEEAPLRVLLQERLEGYKIPGLFKLVKSLPRSGSGKLLRGRVLDK